MINLLLPDQLRELRILQEVVAALPDFDGAGRKLTTRLSAVLDVPVTLVERRGAAWRTVSSAGDVPAADLVGAAWEHQDHPESPDGREVADIAVAERGVWTALRLRPQGDRPLVLALARDWTLSEKLFAEFARHVAASLARLPVRRIKPRTVGVATAYVLSRRLSRARDQAQLQQLIVDTCARAVRAQKASLALYDAHKRMLAIPATYGYPAVLVRHLRVAPGDGIIGSVFLAGRPLRVQDVQGELELVRPRLRYRTASFVSVPLLGVDGTIGVLSVADKRDASAFTRRDLATIRGLAGIAALALDRMHTFESLQTASRDATVDTLTGLFNRRHFVMRLEEEIERARRQDAALTVLMLDVDDFKQLNDRLGHLSGDAVLRVVGDALRRSVRLSDVCARLGGDEFAILMPGSSIDSSAQIAERIRQDVEGSRPLVGPWSDDLKVTTSIGIATGTNVTGDELLARADQALYAAKRAGKNRVHVKS